MSLPNDNIPPNGTDNHAWVDKIKDGLPSSDYVQIAESFKDDELSLYWPDVKIDDLEVRTVHEPDPNAGKWLTDYIDYAKRCSPTSPDIFHEACGLFLISAAIARRVALKTTIGNIYPNLYILLVGPSTIIRKTSAINIAEDLAEVARLLRLPALGTTEGLSIEFSFTKQYGGLNSDSDPTEYTAWFNERALSAQRALITREASKLFEAGRKDYMAQFRELLLELYDCPRKLSFGLTVSRGRATVRNVYLSFLGDTTPAAMRPYFSRNAREWTDGTFARFNFITFETRPEYCFFITGDGDNREVSPGELATRLYNLHHSHLPLPRVTLTPLEINGDTGENIKSRVDVETLTEKSVSLGPDVRGGMQDYDRAIYDACWRAYLGQDEKSPGLYGRLPTTAIKIAMLLATADWADSSKESGIVIQSNHWNRAQWITERWRRSLHRVDSLISRDMEVFSGSQQNESVVEKDGKRILEFLKYKGEQDNRSLQRKFSGMKNGRYKDAIDYLKTEGYIIQTNVERERGKLALAYKAS